MIRKLELKDLPSPPPLKTLLGPSFILLGLGLGSGEVVLWPYMTSHYGTGILWGMLAGITMQFFINMEVARYALINGESIFVGFARLARGLPIWFILSTFLGFGWPGIGLFGSSLLSEVAQPRVHVDPKMIAVVLFLIIGVILSVGKALYQTVEQLQKYLIGFSVPFIVGLTIYLVSGEDLASLAKGVIGLGSLNGKEYFLFPPDMIFGTFLGALAYAGAGGNLNLVQSCYVRDKGYGMGHYANKISNLAGSSADQKDFKITGSTFAPTPENLSRFRKWWISINLEHLLVFWGLGLFTMVTLSLLAYTTTFGKTDANAGIAFVVSEAMAIGEATRPAFKILFLLITGAMLCVTQLTVLDSTSRIIAENIILLKSDNQKLSLGKAYYVVLWLQILFGILVFLSGFAQPLELIFLGAIINAFSMFVYIGIIIWLNNRVLDSKLRPSMMRNLIMIFIFLFFGFFCAVTAYTEIVRVL